MSRHRPGTTQLSRRTEARASDRGDRDNGSAAIEAAIGVPAFLLFVGLIIFAGRMAVAHQSVQEAATDAARTASISRTQTLAGTTARAAALTTLANQGLDCVTSDVNVDTTGFASPVGTPAHITATVTCAVNLSDLSLPGVPGIRTVTATMSSPLDTYRQR